MTADIYRVSSLSVWPIAVLLLASCGAGDRSHFDGAALYFAECSSCHLQEGQGIPGLYPPLVETEWVTGSEERLIRVVMHGLTGPIDVNGVTYRGAMPGHQRSMSSEEIARVINYIRTSWGNHADSVSVETVQRVADEEADRRLPWTEEDLKVFE